MHKAVKLPGNAARLKKGQPLALSKMSELDAAIVNLLGKFYKNEDWIFTR